MVCLLEGLGNVNEAHVYLAKCNLGMRIKCVATTQFGNKDGNPIPMGGWE